MYVFIYFTHFGVFFLPGQGGYITKFSDIYNLKDIYILILLLVTFYTIVSRQYTIATPQKTSHKNGSYI